MEVIASHSCFRLVQHRSLFPHRTLLALVRLPLSSSIPFSPRLVLQLLHILNTLALHLLCPILSLRCTPIHRSILTSSLPAFPSMILAASAANLHPSLASLLELLLHFFIPHSVLDFEVDIRKHLCTSSYTASLCSMPTQ